MPLTTRLILLFSRTVDAFRRGRRRDKATDQLTSRMARFTSISLEPPKANRSQPVIGTSSHPGPRRMTNWSSFGVSKIILKSGCGRQRSVSSTPMERGFIRLRMPSTPTSTRLGLVTARTRLSGIEKIRMAAATTSWRERLAGTRRGDRSYQPEMPHVGIHLHDRRGGFWLIIPTLSKARVITDDPKPHGKSVFEKIDCDLAKRGYLDRLSLSVDQTKICFEFQKGFKRQVPVEHCTSPTLTPRPAPSKTPNHSQTKSKPVWLPIRAGLAINPASSITPAGRSTSMSCKTGIHVRCPPMIKPITDTLTVRPPPSKSRY